jgi:hypothetical protein
MVLDLDCRNTEETNNQRCTEAKTLGISNACLRHLSAIIDPIIIVFCSQVVMWGHGKCMVEPGGI